MSRSDNSSLRLNFMAPSRHVFPCYYLPLLSLSSHFLLSLNFSLSFMYRSNYNLFITTILSHYLPHHGIPASQNAVIALAQ